MVSNTTLAQVAELCDRLVSRWDAFEQTRHDGDRLKGARKDVGDAHLSRHVGKSTLPHLENEVRRLDSLAPARLSLTDVPEYAAVQARYDDAYIALGRRATAPRGGEGLYQYQYRLAEDLLPHCPHFNDIKSLTGVGLSAFRVMEPQIIADCIQEAAHPTMLKKGELREMARYDEAGRKYYEYYGDPDVWMNQFKAPAKRLYGIRTANITGYYPNS
jgi:hypothetical protein